MKRKNKVTISEMKDVLPIKQVLFKGFKSVFNIGFAGIVIQFGINLVLARWMGVADYGVYIYVLYWVNVLALISKLGFDLTLVRFLPKYNIEQKWSYYRGLIKYTVHVVSLLSISLLLISLIIIYIINKFTEDIPDTAFYIGLIMLPLLVIMKIQKAVLQAMKHVILCQLPENILIPLVLMLSGYVIYYLYGYQLSGELILSFNLFAILVSVSLISYLLYFHVIPQNTRTVKSKIIKRKWLKSAIYSLFLAGSFHLINQTDTLMLGIFRNTTEAGIYAIASRVANFTVFGLVSINVILAPMISELNTLKNWETLKELVKLAAKISTIFALIVSIFLLVAGRWVLGLFGNEFQDGYLAMLILSIGHFIYTLCGPAGFILVMTGYEKDVSIIFTITSVINIVLNPLLIIYLGVNGAAIATSISLCFCAMWLVIKVNKQLKINTSIFAFNIKLLPEKT